MEPSADPAHETAEGTEAAPDVEAPSSRRTDSNKDVVIELRDVHKTLSGRPVLRGVNLKVHAGETLVIIGLSGTGKSVTLRHIVGLMQPDRGEVFVFGKNLATLSEKELKKLRFKLGYLFQSGALINWLTIRENVALPLYEHRPELSDREIEAKVLEKLRLVNMEDAVDKLPSQISGGMKKRGGLARAIVLEPQVILYDEPTSGLDPVMGATIDDLVIHTREVLQVSQVVVSHDMESAYRIADRIAMLYDGEIVADGTPDEIRNHPDPLVQQFIHGDAAGPITDELGSRREVQP